MGEVEAFVDADRAAEFLGLTRRRVLQMARDNQLPGHPIGRGRRKTWRFLLSEISEAVVSKGSGLALATTGSTIQRGSSRSQKEKSSHGC